MGYHLNKITKGELGFSCKIQEELDELCDAESQDCKVLILNELCDLYGALQAYLKEHFNNEFGMDDLAQMSQERDSLEPGKSGYLHAEVRAALSCKSDRSVKKEVYVNLPPCLPCAKVLLELGGVCKLYYKPNDYYSDAGIKLLQSVGISCEKYE